MYEVLQQKLWQPPRAITKLLLILKITTFILITVILQVSANSFAQKISLSKKDATLVEVFDQIKAQTGYDFLFNASTLKDARKVSITLRNVDLREALEQLFKDQPLVYSIADQSVVVSRKTPTFLERLAERWAAIDVRGRIVDDKGNPLAGATVTVKATGKFVFTNDKGEFYLREVEEGAVLVVSFVGYASREVKAVKEMGTIQLVLSEGKLDEVNIVNTGYQSISKERVTGSFDLIDEKLLNRSVSTDIISKLKGVASGLNFDSNTAGNSLGIAIRGRSTLVSNTQPLIILDNFPYEGDINNINPNDVETITVLKDAAASSIWGALAGNGVIVITTRKGNFNQPLSIDFNSNLTLQKKPDLFYAGNQFLNSSDYIGVEQMLFKNGFYDKNIANVKTYPSISNAVEILNAQRNGTITADQTNQQLAVLGSQDIRNDLNKYIYKTATLQQYSVNLHGGTSNMNYLFSVGEDNNNNNQNQIGNNYNRLTLNSNVAYRPIKNLELYTNIAYSNSNTTNNSNAPFLTRPGNLYPYASLADANENPLPINKYYNNTFIDSAPGKGLLDWSYSPLEEMKDADNTSNRSDIRINTGSKYTLMKGLSVEIRYQYEKAVTNGRNYFNDDSYTARNLINRFSIINGDGTIKRNIPLGGILDFSNNTATSNYARGQLDYNYKWGKSEINAIAGAEARELVGNGNTSRLYGYDRENGTTQPVNYIDYFTNYPSGGSNIESNSEISQTTDRYRSFFANASYTYNGRYILSASGRLDQSNLFGVNTNQKGVPLWSAGLKWNIAEESFYKVDWLPKLDFRVTYGHSGNVNKTITAYTTAQYSASSFVPSYNYVRIISPGDPDLRWEKVGMLNFGLDFEYKKVLSGSFEYYRKYGSDLIGNSPIAASTGFAAATGNFADISGKGFDLTLTSHNISGTNFSWNTTLLSSYAIDKVTKFLGGNSALLFGDIAVGVPYYSGFAGKFEGLNDQGDPQGLVNGQLSTDYNALLSVPNIDKQWYRTQPAYFGALRNDFTFKQVTLSINLLYKAGYSFLRRSINYNYLFNNGMGNADFDKRWQKPGDELNTTVPAMVYPDNQARDNFYSSSTSLLSNASNVRLQDINVTYLINKRTWAAMPFRSLQVYLYFNNLGIIWRANKYGIDPDFQTGLETPPSASIGLKFGL
jgi:TonB-linked SusC/RagA family outer membrane protein